jgi:hypothetical protein
MGHEIKHMKPCGTCKKIMIVSNKKFDKRKYCSRHCLGVANGRRFQEYYRIQKELIEKCAQIDDHLPDPDEPTPEEQEEIEKKIKKLLESHYA